MSIRFAPKVSRRAPRMAPEQVRRGRRVPANDNGDIVGTDQMHAALRHFARHGLNAAQHAREQAIIAGRAGDRQMFDWWLEICRALDRRMARRLDAAPDLIA